MKSRIGKLHGDYDKDILGVTGIEKLPNEKNVRLQQKGFSELQNYN